jgi:hypothetical protein
MHRSRDLKDQLWVHLNGYGKKVWLYVHERTDSPVGELEKLFTRVRESGFTGEPEEIINDVRQEASFSEAWMQVYQTDYLENWTEYNLAGPLFREKIMHQLNTFFSLHGGDEFKEHWREKFREEMNQFWDKILYLHTTLEELQEEIVLETWLSPAGAIFLYDQLYQTLFPFLEELPQTKREIENLNQLREQELSSFWQNSPFFLEIISFLKGNKTILLREWNSTLKRQPIPSFLEQATHSLPSGISAKNVLTATNTWLMVLDSFPEEEPKRRTLKFKIKNFLKRGGDAH